MAVAVKQRPRGHIFWLRKENINDPHQQAIKLVCILTTRILLHNKTNAMVIRDIFTNLVAIEICSLH